MPPPMPSAGCPSCGASLMRLPAGRRTRRRPLRRGAPTACRLGGRRNRRSWARRRRLAPWRAAASTPHTHTHRRRYAPLRDLYRLALYTKQRSYAVGQVVLAQGGDVRHMHLLLSGSVQLVVDLPAGASFGAKALAIMSANPSMGVLIDSAHKRRGDGDGERSGSAGDGGPGRREPPPLTGEPSQAFSRHPAQGCRRHVLGVRGYGTVLGVDCLDGAGAAAVSAIAMEPTQTLSFHHQKFSTYVDPLTLRLFRKLAARSMSAFHVGRAIEAAREQSDSLRTEMVQHVYDQTLNRRVWGGGSPPRACASSALRRRPRAAGLCPAPGEPRL